MREYTNKITLTENSRGIYSLDPSLGCSSGMLNKPKGCYNDCYAARYSKKYGYDFSKTVLRYFESESHKHRIIKQISKIKMPFIRMGTSGDPSENWAHTVNICEAISKKYQLSLFDQQEKEIVIITKHWTKLTNDQLKTISKYKICINTSVSALDDPNLLNDALEQYERLKPYCKSILRVVSCDFNKKNKKGKELAAIQDMLFRHNPVLDTVFRCNPSNPLVKDGIINIKKTKFLGKKCYVSKYNRKTYFGNCANCLEQCGVKMLIDATKKEPMYDTFDEVDKRLDELIMINEGRLFTKAEEIEYNELKTKWQELISNQDLNPYDVITKRLPLLK